MMCGSVNKKKKRLLSGAYKQKIDTLSYEIDTNTNSIFLLLIWV
jgi:hypothetical protein